MLFSDLRCAGAGVCSLAPSAVSSRESEDVLVGWLGVVAAAATAAPPPPSPPPPATAEAAAGTDICVKDDFFLKGLTGERGSGVPFLESKPKRLLSEERLDTLDASASEARRRELRGVGGFRVPLAGRGSLLLLAPDSDGKGDRPFCGRGAGVGLGPLGELMV